MKKTKTKPFDKYTLTKKQKNKDKKAWYKERADQIENYSVEFVDEEGRTQTQRMKINYDLFNNILNLDDLKHVCRPFGVEIENFPVKMTNKDIVSGKIKALLGMEAKRPFPYKVAAINPEATTRREQAEFNMIKEYVVEQIMLPIRQEIEMQHMQSLQEEGQELTEDQILEVQNRIQEEVTARTPEEVKKYMGREYQDPAELLSHQLLELLTKKKHLKRKFNECFKHGVLTAKEVMYVGIINDEPDALVVNNLRFKHDKSPDLTFIEDGEWASYEHRMTPSDVVSFFSDELEEDDVNMIYESAKLGGRFDEDGDIDLFQIDEKYNDYDSNEYISVIHTVWKAPRKIGYLTYMGEDGQEQMQIVDEIYELNEDFGDISIEWDYLPEVHETWKIKTPEPIYVRMRPVPGQFKDLDNLHYCKLPYYGVVFDGMNSVPTSPMDRLKTYQYLYNTIRYRQELLISSDKGKKVLANINVVPDSLGMKKWQQAVESTPYAWYDPEQEGSGYNDVNTVAKVLDLSLTSDIAAYEEIAESIRQQAGRSVGIPDHVEGQIAPGEAVRNTQQNMIQTSYLLDSYFDLHNHFKKNVLQALLETAKVAYKKNKAEKLVYVLDDLTTEVLNLDIGLLDNSTLGIFITDSGEVQRIKETIEHLSHAAMQNQRIELSDVIKVLRHDNVLDAEEALRLAEDRKAEMEQRAAREKQEFDAEQEELKRERAREEHQEKLEEIIVKEEERRKTEIIKSSLLGASFNPDMDKDRDGVNDFIEIARDGLEAEIEQSKAQLEREKFEHEKYVDSKKLEQEDRKIENEKKKINSDNRKSKEKNKAIT